MHNAGVSVPFVTEGVESISSGGATQLKELKRSMPITDSLAFILREIFGREFIDAKRT